MRTAPTRRDALKASLGAMVGAAIYRALPLSSPSAALGETTARRRSASTFVTDSTGRRHAPMDEVFHPAGGEAPLVFSFDQDDPQQRVLGIGAAFTEASCTVIHQLPDAERAALLDELLNPARCNLNIARLCIGASDYSTALYSYDEGAPDPQLARFSIDHDRAAVLPVLRQARAIRPDLFLFGSPWSPPGWMKYGGSMKGGSLKPHFTEVYSQYILRYLQAYWAAGVNVDAMTIQNEIDADQDGRMPACTWAEETTAEYIVNHLGPALAHAKLPTKLWILDHNYNLFGRVLDMLARPGVRPLVDAVAWHGYVGSPEQMQIVHHRYPELDMHWTEGGDDFESGTLATGWALWASTFATILNNGARSVTTWNVALDETGHPNIGPFHCAGVVTIDSKTRAITRNGIYWALMHHAKAFPRGSRILRSSQTGKNPDKVAAAAATRPDGLLAVVVGNNGPAVRVRLDLRGGSAAAGSPVLDLPEHSVTSVYLG